MAADDDLVAVASAGPLDAAAVDVDAVERAVVEHAHAVGLGDDQRVAARHGGVVEAHVGGQRAADPGPFARDRRRRRGGRRPRTRGTCRARSGSRAPRRPSRAARRPVGRRVSGTDALPGRQRPGRLDVAWRTWVHVRLSFGTGGACRSARPPSDRGFYGNGQWGLTRFRREASSARRRSTSNHADADPPPVHARPRPAAGGRPPAPQPGRARGAPRPLRALPPDPADGRGGPPVRDRRRRAAGLRSLPPAPPRGARALRAHARPGARARRPGPGAPRPPDAGGSTRLPGPWTPSR